MEQGSKGEDPGGTAEAPPVPGTVLVVEGQPGVRAVVARALRPRRAGRQDRGLMAG